MNIQQFILFSIVISFISCTQQKTVNSTPEKSLDSMLLSHIATDFDYQDARIDRISSQLRNLRKGPKENGTYTNVTEASFGSYRLKAFRFDTQSYPPFIVEVTTSDNELVSYFTYTDELYYLENEITALPDDSLRFHLEENRGLNKSNLEKVNLDRNLNELLLKLGIENDLPAILKLIDTVFNHLLELEQYDDAEIDNIMRSIKTTNQLKSILTSEYNHFCNDNSNPMFRFKANEGTFGYWKLMVVPTNGGYKVTSRFFSDALYAAIFL